ncbi:MAG: heme biosynthesis protein HemY [Rhizobiaceae bacterium]
MVRLAIFVLLLFAAAISFAWLADNPGTVEIAWPWLGSVVKLTLLQSVIALAAIVVTMIFTWWVVSAVLHSPRVFGLWRAGRRRDRGYDALSRGLIAAGAGNAPLAKKLSKESRKFLEEEPLVALLDAQTALLEGKRNDARQKFEEMTHREETKLLGLRGLYVEAEREGEPEAAAHFAIEANEHAPGTPWAAQAVLKGQALTGNWEQVLRQLEKNRSSTLIEKDDYKRKRAVILTALAEEEEGANPDTGKTHALAAHKLEPDMVPAAVVAGRLCARTGDMRKAAKVLESTWKLAPHPELADAYINLRSGDSALDRLKRAEVLSELRSNHAEGQFAVAQAALDTGEFKRARDAMQAVLRKKATERACLLMADIEDAEHGDRGRVREWLSRAVTAPKDAAWTADGIVAEHWAPVSPISGQIGAFEWKLPVEALEGPEKAIDYSELAHEKPMPEPRATDTDETLAEAVKIAANATAASKAMGSDKFDEAAEIEAPETADVKLTAEETAEALIETRPEPESPTPVAANDEPKQNRRTDDKPGDPAKNLTPYKNANFDEDEDGVIDHRPDDPGINDAPKKKKAVFF